MTIKPEFEAALKWYSGKSLENAKLALAQLSEAVTLGYWPAGYSRGVCAKLNKMSVAKKWATKTIGTYSGTRYDHPLYEAWSSFFFGSFHTASKLLATEWSPEANPADVVTVKEWAAAFVPVSEAIKTLDATRPKPVYFLETLSATVLGNVGKAMALDLKSLRVPEMEWKLVDAIGPKGEKTREWECIIHWPEGTKHNTSKFARGCSCHACGHLIMNPFNWVPMVGDTATGPVSLWTGKDCAENLFGCKVKNNEVALPGAPVTK